MGRDGEGVTVERVFLILLLVVGVGLLSGIVSGLILHSFFKIETRYLWEAEKKMIDRHYTYQKAMLLRYSDAVKQLTEAGKEVIRGRAD